ncbi:hypothetical protein BDW69DRAFT_162492 [Aspergillus filifer]
MYNTLPKDTNTSIGRATDGPDTHGFDIDISIRLHGNEIASPLFSTISFTFSFRLSFLLFPLFRFRVGMECYTGTRVEVIVIRSEIFDSEV